MYPEGGVSMYPEREGVSISRLYIYNWRDYFGEEGGFDIFARREK